MEIYLVQHGLALSKEQDPDEGLSEEGKKDASVCGKALSRLGVEVDLIVTSPKKRALQTAQAIATELGLHQEKIIETEKVKATIPASESLQELEKYSAKRVMICGHLPSLSEIISFFLCEQKKIDVSVTNTGCILIEIDHLFSHSGTLMWSLTKKQLKVIAD